MARSSPGSVTCEMLPRNFKRSSLYIELNSLFEIIAEVVQIFQGYGALKYQ
ncbi:MAG: hypothetical protein IJ757_08770 [Clostridiales bacterium]|nr:hypothetical protein [Clostridiales bacterium]